VRKSTSGPGSPSGGAAQIRAGLYGRISLARFGETIKVEEQVALCEKVAQMRDWTVTRRYADPNKSAWQRNRHRPAWEQMLRDIDDGVINAIVVYHGDRLIRQPWDLELLIRLADEKGIRLASPTGERDLDNPDDRYILRIEAASACRESDNTSRRLRWHYNKAAEQGVVRLGGRGGRAFGFEPDGMTVREADAEVIREVAGRLLAGEPTGAIARDISARGVRTTAGNPWDHGSLAKLMRRARLAGLVSHHGAIVAEAKWPAILDRDTWTAVCAVLDRRAEKFYEFSTNARVYLLTGIAKCGTCRAPLVIRHNTGAVGALGYGCVAKGCALKVHRSLKHLDPFIDGAMVGLLGDDRIRQRQATPAARDINEELRRVESTKSAMLEGAAGESMSDADARAQADMLRVTVRKLNERIEKLRAELAASQAGHALDKLWGIDIAAWRALPLARRRAAVMAAMTIVVLPSRRGPGFDPATVLIQSIL
jgi:site-specific DNA recombinase